MTVYLPNGAPLVEVPIQANAEHERELMKSDFIRLEWSQGSYIEFPCGSFIVYDGLNYTLLEKYQPEQKDTLTYNYSPEFQHPLMILGKLPFFLVTGDTTSWNTADKETEFSYTGLAANMISELFLTFLNKYSSINAQIGNDWVAVIDDNIKGTETCTFQSYDFLSALNSVADKFECEWHLDYNTRTLYFGKIAINKTDMVTDVNYLKFEVGVNVGTASIQENRDGYYNAFVVKGSTRNISQKNDKGENIQLNKRLSLDTTKYPQGYIDCRSDKAHEPLLIKELVFDEIFPSMDMYIANPRARERYLLTQDGNKITIDKDAQGNDIYKRYSVWYVQLGYLKDGVWQTFVLNKNMLLGELSCQFRPNTDSKKYNSPLVGREFKLNFHDKAETIPGDALKGDTGINILENDFEIVFEQNDTLVIPTTEDEGLCPKGNETFSTDNNIVRLFNLVMDEYTENAQMELEQAALKKINTNLSNRNNYEFQSNPIYFYENFDAKNINLFIGKSCKFVNGDFNLDTRIIKIVQKIDFPWQMTITVGNEKVKSNTVQMREQIQMVYSAYKNNSLGSGNIGGSSQGDTGGSCVLTKPITATTSVGNVNSGTLFNVGTPIENILRSILYKAKEAEFTAQYLGDVNVEYGTERKNIRYTATRNSSGELTSVKIDAVEYIESFMPKDGDIRTWERVLATETEKTWTSPINKFSATAYFAASDDNSILPKQIYSEITISCYRRWFAGQVSKNWRPQGSDDIRSLGGSLLTGNEFSFNVSEGWAWFAIAIPVEKSVSYLEFSINSKGNDLSMADPFGVGYNIPVNDASGSNPVSYKVYLYKTEDYVNNKELIIVKVQ